MNKLILFTASSIFLIGILSGILKLSTSYPLSGKKSLDNVELVTIDSLLPSTFCGEESAWARLKSQFPELKDRHEILEYELYELIKENRFSSTTRSLPPPYELPVVVHVIHDNGGENIPLSQIEQGIQYLNEAFSNSGYYDQGTGTDTRIQFCLATRDPQGNLTNGVNRIQSPYTNMNSDTDDLIVKDLMRWDPKEYINIWLVKEICKNSGCGVAGYAYFPSAHGRDFDGIMMESRWFGSSEGASGVIIHEMGHYLGLYHTFQGGCRNDDCLLDGDRVCDTPPDQTTARVPCNSSPNSCATDVNLADPNNPFIADQPDMFINYMDYSDFDCYSAFTNGQALRMHFSIDQIRSSLLNSKACEPPCTQPIIAGFSISNDTIFSGTLVNFTNTTTGATTYQWTVNGVTFSGDSYTFNNPGVYEIVLVATNDDPNCESIFSLTITVLCPVEANYTASDLSPIVGQDVTFTSTSSNATNYQWTINGTTIGTSSFLTYNFSSPGIYVVCLEVDNGNCMDEFCQNIFVQRPTNNCLSETWINIIGTDRVDEVGAALVPTGDGGLYLGGRQGAEILLMKISAYGEIIWQRKFNPTNRPDEVTDVMIDSENNILITGYGGSLTTYTGDYTGFVIKYDHENDQVIWTSTSQFSARTFNILESETNGNYLLVMDKHVANRTLASMAELDRNTGLLTGNLHRNYSFNRPDIYNTTIQLPDGLFATGRFTIVPLSNGSYRFVIARMDTNGNTQFIKAYPHDTNVTGRFWGRDIVESGGKLIVSGGGNATGTDLTVTDVFLMEAEKDGSLNWFKQYNIPIFRNPWAEDVIAVDDGYIMYGFDNVTPLSIFLIKTDLQGEVQWAKTYTTPGNETFKWYNGNTILSVGDFIMFTARTDNFSSGDDDILLIRTDENGNIENLNDCIEVRDFAVQVSPIANARAVDINIIETDQSSGMQSRTISTVPTMLDQTVCLPDSLDCPEVCDNNLDDDGDGLIDCADPDCCDSLICVNVTTPCDTPCIFSGILDLGPDISVCDNGVYNFNAGNGFSTYLWSDQTTDSTFTSDGPGIIWVQTTDSCGNIYRDSVNISIIAQTKANLGPDIRICQGDSAILSAGIFDQYRWFSKATISCDTCPAITIYPDSNTIYSVLVNSNIGCYSLDTILVMVDTIPMTNETLHICGGDTIEVFGQTITTDSNLEQTFVSTNGCDSIHQVEVRLLDTVMTMERIELCEGSSVQVFGQTITTDSILEQTFISTNGCDSTHQIEVRLLDTVITSERIDLCEGSLVQVFGQTVTTDSNLEQTFVSANGCDSTHQVEVRLQDTVMTAERIDICEGSSVQVFGQTITTDSDLERTFVSANGCDSTHQVEVRLLDTVMTKERIDICEGSSVQVFGQTITTDSNLEQTFVSANGCDSTHQVAVLVIDTIVTSQRIDICEGETVQVFGQTITTDSFLEHTYTALNGCDSTHQVEVQVRDTSLTSERIQLCEGESVQVFGQTITTDSDLEQTFVSANGCDSTHQVAVRLLDTIITSERIVLCEGESVQVFGQTVSTDSLLEQIYISTGGCDSMHQVAVRFLDTVITSEQIVLCEGESVQVFGQTITTDSDLEQTFVSVNGCDSMHQVAVRFLDTVITSDQIVLCEGESVQVFGQTITTDSDLERTFVSANGCDSTHQVAVRFLDTVITSEQIVLCEGESVQVFGQTITTDSDLEQTFASANGCDSTHQVAVRFLDTVITSEQIVLCEGESVQVFGQTITTDSDLEQTFVSANGCDSTHQVEVQVRDTSLTTERIELCEGESVQIFGQTITTDSFLEQTYTSLNGCDSTHQVEVQVRDTSLTTERIELCEGESVQIFGQTITTDSFLEQTYISLNGCDSTHQVDVQFNDTIITSERIQLCEGDTIQVFGQSVNTDSSLEQTYTSLNGCDSTHQVEVIFINEILLTDSITLCPSEFIIFNGDTIREPGTYEYGLTPTSGNCDTIQQLIVKLHEFPQVDLVSVPACPSDSNGQLIILNSQNDWLYSLDGINYQPSPLFNQLKPGIYNLWIEDGMGCILENSFTILATEIIASQLQADTTILLGDSIEIPIIHPDTIGLSFNWSPSTGLSCTDCPYPVAFPTNQQRYNLVIRDGFGCSTELSIIILVEEDIDVYIPNVFSPNGDNINDVFTIFSDNRIEEVDLLQVFNRWGALVYEGRQFSPNDPSYGWDGSFKGETVDPGVFVYQCWVRLDNGRVVFFSGDVTLVR